MGVDPLICLSDPLYRIDPEITAECDAARRALETETHDTGTVAPNPSPEDRSRGGAEASDRLRRMTAAHEAYVADSVPADAMHPAGAPRAIRFGRLSVDAWEVESSEFTSHRSGDVVPYGSHGTHYRVFSYEGRTYLINESQNVHHDVDTITRAAARGRTLSIVDRALA